MEWGVSQHHFMHVAYWNIQGMHLLNESSWYHFTSGLAGLSIRPSHIYVAIRKSRRLLFPFAAIRRSHQLLRSSQLPLADTRVLSASSFAPPTYSNWNIVFFFAIGSSRQYQSGIPSAASQFLSAEYGVYPLW